MNLWDVTLGLREEAQAQAVCAPASVFVAQKNIASLVAALSSKSGRFCGESQEQINHYKIIKLCRLHPSIPPAVNS
jgi:hypothetical protein